MSDKDWRDENDTWEKKMIYMLNTSLFADVKFIVTSGKNKKLFNAHELFLSSSSPVFEAELKGNFKEGITKTIEINDVDPAIFEKFLLYLYTNKIKFESATDCMEMYKVADKYMVSNLKYDCKRCLMANMHIQTVLKCLECANNYRIEDLKNELTIFLRNNAREVIFHQCFLHATIAQLIFILDEKFVLNVTELELFFAIGDWIINFFQICEKKIKVIEQNKPQGSYKKALCKMLLSKINYRNMTPEEFVAGPIKSGLLEREICSEILTNLVCPDNSPYPYPNGYAQERRSTRASGLVSLCSADYSTS